MPAGRPAREAPPAWNVAKTLLQTVWFWGFFLFLLPAAIVRLEHELAAALEAWPHTPRRPILGAAIFAAFGTLGLTSGLTMSIIGRGTPMPQDCPRRLVVIGPYRFVRNPMAVAGLMQGVGVALRLGSSAVLLYAFAGFIVWNFAVRRWEEADLLARFGPSFEHYRDRVPCWIPRLTPYRAPDPATTTPASDPAATTEPSAR